MNELYESMHVYTWGQPVFVAFVDILGFQAALESSKDAPDLTFGLWRNCLPLRSMLSEETPKLNFVQMSDALVIYGDSEKQVLDLVCNVFGAAVVWGVPMRGGIGYGVVNVDEEAQAWSRARASEGDRGGKAAQECLEIVALKRQLLGQAR